MDSGGCASAVGADTLDLLEIKKLENTGISQKMHRLGNHNEEHESLFAAKFRLFSDVIGRKSEQVSFNIKFDVIPGHLPFLIVFLPYGP